jgi:hypothetical protein
VRRLHISLALTGLYLLLAAAPLIRAQYGLDFPPLPSDTYTPRQRKIKILDRYPLKPSLPPAFTIPVGPLGFFVPGDNYLLRHQTLMSLDFLDEDRLLFTFRVSGLMQRDVSDDPKGTPQQIKAMVVVLSTSKIESQAAWIVPDRSRYLWMLNDGHFLLRVSDGLDQGDSHLKTTSSLRLPGRLLWIQMDPSQQFIMANSLEATNASQKPGEPDSSPTSQSAASADPQKPGEQSVLVTRTLKRASGDVIRVSRVPWTGQESNWPMNSNGYLERVHEGSDHWLLKLNAYAGGDRVLARLDSTCLPKYSYLSETELLVTKCDPNNDNVGKLAAISTHGELLWEVQTSTNAIWPLLATSTNGLRMARETLLLKRSVERYKRRMLSVADFEGQMVRIFDAANGKVMLEAPLTPILDAGGNVAISPSGQRVAILNAGAIQIFQLPAPAPLLLHSARTSDPTGPLHNGQ